jgi:hypothetical protein
MTPEGRVKSAVKKLLGTYKDVYYFMPVQYGMGASTVDFLCAYRGLFFAIETKAPGNRPTPRQDLIMSCIRNAGAPTFVVDGSESIMMLKEWMDNVTRQFSETKGSHHVSE